MRRLTRNVIVLLLINYLFTNNIVAQYNSQSIKNGTWLGIIKRADGNEIPFNFTVQIKKGKQLLTILNASERLAVTEIVSKDDSILIKLPFFASSLIVKQSSPTLLKGYYIKNYVTRKQIIPFTAYFGVKNRFSVNQKPKHSLSGTWDVLFTDSNKDSTKAIGNFVQKNGCN